MHDQSRDTCVISQVISAGSIKDATSLVLDGREADQRRLLGGSDIGVEPPDV